MNDLISRSALLEVLENLRQRNPHSDARSRSQHNSEITSCIHRVIMQPTVDAVPVVHGEWIKGDLGEWQCSICREENCYAYSEKLKRFTDLYCPACGAKMDGKKV